MKIFVLSSYTDGLNDPIVSTDYEKVYENMKRSYNLMLDGVKQMEEEKENTYLEAYSAQAVVQGSWMEWRILELELPIDSIDIPAIYPSSNAQKTLIQKMPKNPFLLSYFQHKGLSVGDYYLTIDYMFWINQKHDKFRALHHLPEHITLNDIETAEFIQYLNSDLIYE